MKKYNFNAGPSILPREVIEQTAQACLDFEGSGLSLMEISHRAKNFQPVVDEAVALFKELLDIPEGYSVLFLGGGASLQFCMLPYNFLEKKAAYLNTGVWATKAEKEAKLFGEVVEVASSKDRNFTYIPKDFTIPTDVDVSKYTVIYGGAQKNLSMAGVTFVIIKNDAIGKVSRQIPTMLNYETHIKKGSMFNTPPVVPIYSALMNLRYIKAKGGVAAMDALAKQRAEIVYSEIDRNRLFVGTAEEDSRSLMNLTFVLKEEYKDLQDEFLAYATSQGMVGVKGHRDVGGFRASCYNAMSIEGCEALVKCMKEFEAKH